MTRLLRSRWSVVAAAVLVFGGPLAWYLVPTTSSGSDAIETRVKQGTFRVVVTTSGELQAQKSVKIQGPPGVQQVGVYQMKISSIVPEGTAVKQGDVVAELDRSQVAAKEADVVLALQKAQAQYTSAQLDSALTLSQAREDIRNFELGLEEKKLAKEQSTYEAPTIRRQADIDLEKAQRALDKGKADYQTKKAQAVAKMSEAAADLEQQRDKLAAVQKVMQDLTIRAPAPGMVIYMRDWNGQKEGTGSQVSAWDPVVATLPDLRHMESITYVNEIDVRKVAVGQQVKLALDADPSRKLTGRVESVANVGEQRPNNDAKVFEVKIAVDQSDTTLRPGMTTSNAIETMTVPNALYVPLEAVALEGNLPYVFKRDGGRVVRQQVETGAMNDDEIVIRRGLAKGDAVLMAPPADVHGIETVHLPAAAPATTSGSHPGGDEAAPAVVVPPKPAAAPR